MRGVDTKVSHLRSDARRNRDRILDVAGELFAERGIDVPMAAIARRAGVGVATLYRRFPTKESLVTELFADRFAVCAAVVDEALEDPDPWRGFRYFVERIAELQAEDHGFSDAFVAAYPGAIDVDGERSRALARFAELVDRAKATGKLRADFSFDDLFVLYVANNAVARTPAASRRLVAYLLDAFRAEDAVPRRPLPPPARLRLHDVC